MIAESLTLFLSQSLAVRELNEVAEAALNKSQIRLWPSRVPVRQPQTPLSYAAVRFLMDVWYDRFDGRIYRKQRQVA